MEIKLVVILKSNLALCSENRSGITDDPAISLQGTSLENPPHSCLRGHLEEHVTLVVLAEFESNKITNRIDW